MATTSRTDAKSFYRPQLDAVRALAFFAVFLHHTLPRGADRSQLLLAAGDACGFGLCLFFVLSAYLITLLLLREKERSGSIHLRLFYIRRALRIWPLYLLGLLIGFVMDESLQPHGLRLSQKHWYVAALIMCGNLARWSGTSVSHLWSISVEEQFYVFFPASVRRLDRRGIAGVALLMIFAANATLFYFTLVHANLDVRVWSNTLVQFEMFAAGVLLALVDARLPRWSTPVSGLMICAVPILWLAISYVSHIKRQDTDAQHYLAVSGGYALVALSCCLAIVAVQQLPVPAFAVWLGTVSYGLYVFHGPVLQLTERILHGSLATQVFDWRVVPALAVTILCAALSYRFLELPFLRLKRRFEVVHARPAEVAMISHDRTAPARWRSADVKRRLRRFAAACSVFRTGDRRPGSLSPD